MNDTIKQLLKNIGFKTFSNTDVVTNYHWGGYMNGNDFDDFAKLIVKECCAEILMNGYQNGRMATPEELVKVLRQRFEIDQ